MLFSVHCWPLVCVRSFLGVFGPLLASLVFSAYVWCFRSVAELINLWTLGPALNRCWPLLCFRSIAGIFCVFGLLLASCVFSVHCWHHWCFLPIAGLLCALRRSFVFSGHCSHHCALWMLLSSLIDPLHPSVDFWADCLDAAHVLCAYIHDHFVKEVRSLPWSLSIGDICAYVGALMASEESSIDGVAKKIQQFVPLRCNRV